MKRALLFTLISCVTAAVFSVLSNTVAPQRWARTAEAQTCCNPPVSPTPTARWPKNTEVRVKIQAGVFDDIEIDAIKAAFKAFDDRRVNNCSNVSYPEPYELVNTPPPEAGNVFYVRYDGNFTAPNVGITVHKGIEAYYARTTLFRNMRTLVQPQVQICVR